LPITATLRILLVTAISLPTIGTATAAEESLGTKIKKLFAATPTPTPARKHRKHSAKESTPTPSPTASPKHKRASPSPSPSPTASPKSKRKKTFPSPELNASPSPSASVTGTPEETSTPSPSETPTPTASPTPSPNPNRKGAPNASVSPNEIAGYEDYPTKARKIIDFALELTQRNLDYTYGSADPANGGMDCSGFIYYVLRQNGITDVPRDASQQYVWLRKAGNFRAVLSHNPETFELDALKPGDLLFWSGTYNIERDPPVTHTMIYVGREKGTHKRIMIGASDGRSYDGQQRFGVSVFDFKLAKPPPSNDAKLSPIFVGYGRIPGLSED
jgi:peptidoglycan DL-endopeptidase CwlO